MVLKHFFKYLLSYVQSDHAYVLSTGTPADSMTDYRSKNMDSLRVLNIGNKLFGKMFHDNLYDGTLVKKIMFLSKSFKT